MIYPHFLLHELDGKIVEDYHILGKLLSRLLYQVCSRYERVNNTWEIRHADEAVTFLYVRGVKHTIVCHTSIVASKPYLG